MTLSRKLSLGRGREGRESLLVKPDAAVRSNKSYRSSQHGSLCHNTSDSGGSDSFEPTTTTATKNLLNRTASLSPSESPVMSRGKSFMPEDTSAGVTMHFAPAYDEKDAAHDTSWDAILDEEADIFPAMKVNTGSKSEVGGVTSSSNRFRRKAQSTIAPPPLPPASSSKVKGTRIARLASLFSGKDSKTSAPKLSSFTKKSPNNTTDSTLPSSPSRSSSSGGYVNWPNTLNKRGEPVIVHSSYEESESGPTNVAEELPYANYEGEQAQIEMQEWMESAAFQDISGVSHDPPSPPGEKADDSIYHQQEQRRRFSTYSNQLTIPVSNLYKTGSPWEENSAPSPSRSEFTKASSAYFSTDPRPTMHGDTHRMQIAANVMRGVEPQPPTEKSLEINNSLSPPHRTFHAESARGYRGLLEKTRDVPNLIDEFDSDSMSSSRTSSAVPSSAGVPTAYRQGKLGPMPLVEEEFPTRDSSDVFDEISKYSIGDSEPFEGISQSDSRLSQYEFREAQPYDGLSQSILQESKASLSELRNTAASVERRHQMSDNNKPRNDKQNMKVVLLGGGLTTIQTTSEDFGNRITAQDFDECLTNSDIDEYGSARLPSFQEMAAAGRSVNDSASAIGISMSLPSQEEQLSKESVQSNYQYMDEPSPTLKTRSSDASYRDDESTFFSDFYPGSEVDLEGDLSEYYVQPACVKKLVRMYRRFCRVSLAKCQDHDELDKIEDEKKAFALFEMRSRIMEKDIERGLERGGGTTVVDDMMTTSYYCRSMRIRDAVIVSKAWRDGATPMDVMNTANLTQRDERSYFIKRPISGYGYRSNDSFNESGYRMSSYHWEQRTWVDDADFMQYWCPSLGPRNLRGSEMFTIGDCQSILLKLTNEACTELRAELNEATARQIEAEELLKAEGDTGHGMMTEAEMTYLSSMEDVKTVSKRLVVAERAFALVRDRIRNLIAKYETLLVKIDNEDMATSSVITAESSCFSDGYASRVSTDYEQEERAWYRRQQRAEVSAELAAREALLEKQGPGSQDDKRVQLEDLQKRLDELQSDPSSSATGRQRSVVLAKAIARRNSFSGRHQDQHDRNRIVRDNQVKVEDVKKRFRDRMAARMRQNKSASGNAANDRGQVEAPSRYPYINCRQSPPVKTSTPNAFDRNKLIRLAGEEMFSSIGFYERSLQAVENQQES